MLFLPHDRTRCQFFVVKAHANPAQQIRHRLGGGYLDMNHDRVS